jgi:hypothetical protein
LLIAVLLWHHSWRSHVAHILLGRLRAGLLNNLTVQPKGTSYLTKEEEEMGQVVARASQEEMAQAMSTVMMVRVCDAYLVLTFTCQNSPGTVLNSYTRRCHVADGALANAAVTACLVPAPSRPAEHHHGTSSCVSYSGSMLRQNVPLPTDVINAGSASNTVMCTATHEEHKHTRTALQAELPCPSPVKRIKTMQSRSPWKGTEDVALQDGIKTLGWGRWAEICRDVRWREALANRSGQQCLWRAKVLKRNEKKSSTEHVIE